MPKIRILEELLAKKTWTKEEQDWLYTYLENNDSPELRELLRKSFEEDLAAGKKIPSVISDNMRNRIFSKIGVVDNLHEHLISPLPNDVTGKNAQSATNISPVRRMLHFSAWRTAAAVVLLFGSGIAVYFSVIKKSAPGLKNNYAAAGSHPADTAIVPGSNKAILQLSNGSVVTLDSSGKKNLIAQLNTQISNQDGKLLYKAVAENAVNDDAPVAYNTLITPKGGQYQVVLQDGTRVWLNAASSLKYPTVFRGNQRNVELTGEAYFEVAKNKNMPFHVLTRNHVQVEVLGTHFDIMAYEEEGTINTTLAEGSVRLTKDKQSVLLTPGQQGVLKQNADHFNVSEANLEQALAWQKGLFQFDNLDIETIMRQVARWYDVEISYDRNLQKQIYSGTVPRKENIPELLKLLEYTGTVHFIIDGRKIIVTK